MSWRKTIVFKPLFGEQDFIDNFIQNNKFEKLEEGDKWAYRKFKGSTQEMCEEICQEFPGITFYGYQIEDTTCEQFLYRQIMFNKQDGLTWTSTKTYQGSYDTCPIFDDVCIRGQAWINYETEQITDTKTDDENSGYCASGEK